MRNTITETITHVHHWNDTLFSFKTTRAQGFTFENGQFVMIGLEVDGRPLLRAYSIASANYEDELEFFSIKVPDGALTSRLQRVKEGDEIIITTRPTGTLVPGYLTPGNNLFLLATGTGLAPFMSIVRDPNIYEDFEKIIVVHSVRWRSELAYFDDLTIHLPNNPYFGDDVAKKLIYFPIVTRDSFQYKSFADDIDKNLHTTRITDLLISPDFTAHLGLPSLSPARDRFMLCGNNPMLEQTMAILDGKGFSKANSRTRGDYVIEQAFIDK